MSSNRGKRDDFIVQGSILAAAAVISRIIGAAYRIPLTNILGEEGMGFYAVAFQAYALALILSSFAFPVAVSKLVSARIALKQRKNAFRVFVFALFFAVLVGIFVFTVIFFQAEFIATTFFNQPLAAYALRVLAVGLLVVAVMGVVRGYFQGLGTMIPTAISQIVEQIFNAIVSLVGAFVLIRIGAGMVAEFGDVLIEPAYGAAGGTLGTVAGSVFGLGFLGFAFLIYRKVIIKQMKRDTTTKTERYRDIAKIFILTTAPIIFSTAIYDVNALIDMVFFGNVMRMQGVAREVSAAYQGIYSGMYMVLVSVPLAIAAGLSASSIPSLTAAVTKGNRKEAQNKIGQVFCITTLITIPCFVAFVVLSAPLMTLLFGNRGNDTAALLLSIGAITVVLYSLTTVTNAILQGINKITLPARNAAIALGFHIVTLTLLLMVFELGIYSLAGSNIVFSLVMAILNIRSIRKYSGFRLEIERTFIKPLIGAVVMGIIAYLIYLLLSLLVGGRFIPIIITILIAVLVYGFVVLKLGTLSRSDIMELPMGARIYKVAKKARALPKNYE
ncbi:MAG: polysaccharide biosynthesis protein [Lachnospiraceae bacterium]|nr:polysaccharide biosynthesis protein [Lachnospiraceae bacterium]